MPRAVRARGRRRARWTAGFALAALCALVLPLAPVMPAPDAEAAKASGGSGQYVQSIEWLEWGAVGAAVANGTRTTSSTIAGQTLAVTCTMSNLSGGLLVYRPGAWSGDAFDDLYNRGGTAGNNTLAVGLRPDVDGGRRTFDIACSATYAGAPLALGGLVFADAEQSGGSEHVAATAASGTTWRIVDRYRNTGCTQSSYGYRPSTNSTRLELYGPPTASCSSGPAAVAFAQGATSLSSVTIQGGGLSAIALGVMVTLDAGDAPATYGEAGALLQAQYTGGEIPTTSLGWSTTSRGADLFAAGFSLATPATATTSAAGTIGALIDGEAAYLASAGTADDTSGIDDEDAQFTFTSPTTGAQTTSGTLQVAAVAGGSYSVTVSCTGTGAVRGWIDWQRDGRFTETADASQQTACASGTATLTWTAPATTVASPSTTPTYLRLRTGVAGTALLPTGVIGAGEVEDHPIVVTLPGIAVDKTATPGETTAVRPGQVVTYTVTTRNTGGQRLAAPTIVDDLAGVLSNASFGPAAPTATLNGAATTAPTRSGTELRWSAAALAPGDVVVLTYAATVSTSGRGLTLDNGVQATGTPAGSTAAISAIDEVIHPIAVAVVVDKRWTINGGTALANGSQPSWLSATPTISGQASATFGTIYEGYATGSAVQIGETVAPLPAWMPGCTISARTITEVNGAARSTSIAAGSAAVTLTQGLNRIVVTNAVSCSTTLTLAKAVQNGAASPGDFTLTATGPTTFSGRGGSAAASAAITADASYVLSETGPATYAQQGGWACLPLDGTGASVSGSGWTDAPDDRVSPSLGMHVRCTATNATASLVLLERIENPVSLTADQFQLTASPAAGVAGLQPVTVTGSSTVTASNTIQVRPGHGYALTSTSTAAHISLRLECYTGAGSTACYSGSVAPTDAQLADQSNWRTQAGETAMVAPAGTAYYRFVAASPTPFSLPATGGIGADQLHLLGGGLAALALLTALGLPLLRRRRAL